MKNLRLTWDNKLDQDVIMEVLQQGLVVAGTSDTVPGLLADVTQNGFDQLNAAKQRFEKPYLVLIGSQVALPHFVQMPLAPEVQKIIDACWPGPLTIIFRAKQGLPNYLCSEIGTIALRMPGHRGLLDLLEHFDGLYSTSANISGEAIPATVDQLDPRIVESVAYVIGGDDEQKEKNQKPSTIIDCSGPEIVLIRQGAYSLDDIRTLL